MAVGGEEGGKEGGEELCGLVVESTDLGTVVGEFVVCKCLDILFVTVN